MAASGSRMSWSCSSDLTTRAGCSSIFLAYATTSACSQRNTTPSPAGCSGNFPQAFSHVGLINTALNLGAQPAQRRSGPKGPKKRLPGRRLADAHDFNRVVDGMASRAAARAGLATRNVPSAPYSLKYGLSFRPGALPSAPSRPPSK